MLISFTIIDPVTVVFFNPHVLYLYNTWQEFEIQNLDGGDAFSVTQLWSCKLHRLHVSDEALTDISLVRKSFVTFSLNPLCPFCMLHAELCSGVQNFSEEPFVTHQLCSWGLLCCVRQICSYVIKNSPQAKQILQNICASLSELTSIAAPGCTQRVFKYKVLWENVVSQKTLCVRCSFKTVDRHHHHHHHHQYFTEMHLKNGLSDLG